MSLANGGDCPGVSVREDPMLEVDLVEGAALGELVRQHHVVFEAVPVQVVLSNELRTIGYDVLLLGTHEHAREAPRPGCEQCLRVWEHLARIAQRVIPERQQSTLEIQPYRPTLEYDPHEGHAVYVRLVIEIRHASGYDSPADECEMRCLGKIKQAMKALGIRQR